MSGLGVYAGSWLGTAFACLALKPLVVMVGQKWGVLDLPNSRRRGDGTLPRFGGLSIAIPFLAIGSLCTVLANRWGYSDGFSWQRYLPVLSIGAFVLLLGLWDDIFEIRSQFKLLGLVVASGALCAAGVRIDTIVLHGLPTFYLGIAAWPLTVLWLVAMTVSINFSDGLDGLASGLSSIASAVISAVAIWSGQIHVAILAISLSGGLAGFLSFNLHPTRVRLGRCGSLFIGFMLACLCVLILPHSGTTAGLVLPAIALSIPLLDAFLTLIRRSVISRRSMFLADRGHVHYRLQDMGLCQRHAVLILCGCSLIATGIGLLALLDSGVARVGGFLLLIPLLVGLFRTAGSARLRETVAAVRRNRAIARESRRYQRAFEDMQLRFRAVENFDSWWTEVCAAGEKLDFASVQIPLVSRDKVDRALIWMNDEDKCTTTERISAAVSIRDRRNAGHLQAHVVVTAQTTLESAGHRLALFSRLMGEYHPGHLPQTSARLTGASDAAGAIGRSGNHEDFSQRNWPRPGETTKRIASSSGNRADGHRIPDRSNRENTGEFDGPADQRSMRTGSRGDQVGLTESYLKTMLLAVKSQTHANPLVGAKPNRTAVHLFEWSADSIAGETNPRREMPQHLRVAIVHDFLYCYAGAEKVLEQIVSLFPNADLFSLVDFLPGDQRGFILNKPVTASFIQKMPLARRKHRAYLPLMPFAAEQLNVSSYDLVLSSSYLAAKGVITGPDQLHICYCHTPPRFAWDLQHQYLLESGLARGVRSVFARLILHYIRNWDAHSAAAVDVFVTNSDFVGRRIDKLYRRSATTIYPPVAVNSFASDDEDYGAREDFYLTASRMVPYKRIDLIIDTFNAMPDRRLLVVGEGPMLEKMRAKAGPNIRIVGHQSFANLKRYMHLAKAFIFAAEEDFGIVPVEAQACGTPVIAFGRGGVTESVIAGKTGVFFSEQTIVSLTEAIKEFEAIDEDGGWDQRMIRENAERFSIDRFREEYLKLITDEWDRFCSRRGKVKPGIAAAIPPNMSHAPEFCDHAAVENQRAVKNVIGEPWS